MDKWPPNSPPALLGVVLVSVLLFAIGCADKAAIHEQERSRYESLESEMISAQAEEERSRRAEFLVAQKLQQMDSDRAAAARARQQALNETLTAEERDAASLAADSTPEKSSTSTPVVTQVVIGQAPAGVDDRVWTLQNIQSPVDGSPLCAVVSTPVVVRNGTVDTTVSIIVGSAAVFLRTDASFDTAAVETGYSIDAGLPMAFDRYFNELTAVVDESLTRLLDAMQSGTTLSVAFAYSPQLSSADTYVVELALDSFEKPWSELARCETRKTGDAPADSGDTSDS
jgi:hypothetical protein